MLMEDCQFYQLIMGRTSRCAALTEMVCRKEECSFYKPIGVKNEREDTKVKEETSG